MEAAKKLTNAKLFSTVEQTREQVELKEGEHFWFEIIGCEVVEGNEVLGQVETIDRMADTDYLAITTAPALVEAGLPRSFLLPYIPRYIVTADTATRRIVTRDARDVLEAS